MQPFGHKGRLEDERMLKGSGRYVADWNLVKKGLALAAEELEAAPADVEFLEGKYRIKGTDREVALAALAKKHPGRLDVDLKEKKVGTTFPNGCHIAEVEIEAGRGRGHRLDAVPDERSARRIAPGRRHAFRHAGNP